jgi:hypothetical protein
MTPALFDKLTRCVPPLHRSYLGDRDSEAGVVIGSSDLSTDVDGDFDVELSDSEDESESELARVCDPNVMSVQMGGKPFLVNRLVRALRLQLMNEHVGLPLNDAKSLSDICSSAWRKIWIKVARTNTNLYEAAFQGIASDRFKTLAQYDAGRFVDANDELASQLDAKIRGHLQFHPHDFLADERENTSMKEYLMSIRLFV